MGVVGVFEGGALQWKRDRVEVAAVKHPRPNLSPWSFQIAIYSCHENILP